MNEMSDNGDILRWMEHVSTRNYTNTVNNSLLADVIGNVQMQAKIEHRAVGLPVKDTGKMGDGETKREWLILYVAGEVE